MIIVGRTIADPSYGFRRYNMEPQESKPGTKYKPAVGIDLGTTYSLVAYLDREGRPACARNPMGDVLTPSAVLIDEDEIAIGKKAVRGAVFSPHRYADCFKRDMGRAAFRRTIRGMHMPPEVLSGLVLEALKHDVERSLGPVHRAVITVPAYFDELRRKATQDAGRLAGWDVLDIINEPAAAALCCGYERGYFGLRQPENSGAERVLVYDLGGGTFDVSLLEMDGATVRTLATDGDVQLGGKDFDQRLVNYLAEQFLAAHGLDPRADPGDAVQLWQDAQDAKHALSDHSQTAVICFHGGIRMRIDLTRELFEELTADLLERTRDTADVLVRQAGLTWQHVDRVLLTGGATRMPMVGEMLHDLTGTKPNASLSPDEAVAHGAALYAGTLQGHPALSGRHKCEMIHVNSHSLGVVGIEEKSQQRVNAVLIPRNTPIPAEAVKSFRTHEEGQHSVAVPVVEGESERPEFCVLLGKCVVRDLPPGLPKGTEVDVCYRYLANGRLAVSARIPTTGHAAGVEIERGHAVVEGSLSRWKERLLGRRLPLATAADDELLSGMSRVDGQDWSNLVKQLDALYIRTGRLAAKLTLPESLSGSRQAVMAGAEELEANRRTVVEAERRREGTIGSAEAVQVGAELSRARAAQREAADRLTFAYLVLGRECANVDFCPPGAEADLQEIRYLRRYLG